MTAHDIRLRAVHDVPERVFLVDDHPVVLEGIGQMLRSTDGLRWSVRRRPRSSRWRSGDVSSRSSSCLTCALETSLRPPAGRCATHEVVNLTAFDDEACSVSWPCFSTFAGGFETQAPIWSSGRAALGQTR